jgi:hypothetical protein
MITITHRRFLAIVGIFVALLYYLSSGAGGQPIGSNTGPAGPVRLGSVSFAVAGNASNTLNFGSYRLLTIEYVITGYSGSDIGAFQFNGDTTAANYGSWFLIGSNAATPLNTQATNIGTTPMIPVSGTGITLGRRGKMTISNVAGNNKVVRIENSNESGTTTGPSIETGWGTWLNTTSQITSIQMKLVGANNLGAGTFAIVYGDNP